MSTPLYERRSACTNSTLPLVSDCSISASSQSVLTQASILELLKTNTRMFIPPKLKKTIEKNPVEFQPEPYQEREVLGIYHAVDAVTDMQFSEKYGLKS